MTTCLPVAFLGVGAPEILLILVVALVLLGPREMAGFARNLGRFVARLRTVSDSFQSEFIRISEDIPSGGPSAAGCRETGEDAPGGAAAAVGPVPEAGKKDADHGLAG